MYTRIGGHAYGYIYPGPIGKILNPQIEGLEAAGVLATASSLCNACEEVCPVKIPIPDLLRRIRNETYARNSGATIEGHGYKSICVERLIWKAWAVMNTHPQINAAGQKVMESVKAKLPRIGPLKQWTRHRAPLELARKSLHELVKEHGVDDE